MKYRNRLKLLIILTGLFLILIAGSGFAQETKVTGSSNNDTIYYDPATLPEGYFTMDSDPNFLIKINSIKYQTGTIDRMAGNEIVIGDSLYKYTKGVLFLSRQGAKIETRWFKKGDRVRFVINSKYEAIIIRKL